MRPCLFTLVLAACGSDDPAPGDTPREVVTDMQTLQPGQLLEAMMSGAPGDLAVIEVDASVANLDWNIHGHPGGATQVVAEELGAMQIRYTFEPPAAGDWNLLLRNADADALTLTIRVELYGDLQWFAP